VIVWGLVLAGGRSSRFGREKAGVELDGQLLIARVVDVLARDCDRVAVNARPGSRAADFAAAQGFDLLSDNPADPQGPLAGIKAGLAWAAAGAADALVTAPCDTPFLPDDLVARLAGDGGAAVVRTAAGLHPLCAQWPVSRPEAPLATRRGPADAGPAQAQNPYILIVDAFARGQHPPIRHILAELKAAEVMFSDSAAFANLNTPQDYTSALALISGRAAPK